MKLCIPVVEEKGTESKISEHFGSAPGFLLFDTETETVTYIANWNQHHSHGQCHPLKVLAAHSPDAVVCGGMGKGAVATLHASGIKTYLGKGLTAKDVIAEFNAGRLEELTVHHACGGHGGCH